MRTRTTFGFLGGLGAGAGVGAGLMYLFDPLSGRRRRAMGRDRLRHFMRRERVLLEKGARDLEHRMAGAVERLSPHGDDSPSDHVIEQRVRAALGRAVTHPSAIQVHARDGRVLLEGPILQREVRELMRRVSRVAGVRAIENRLDAHATGEGVPALQGAGRIPPRHVLERDIWPPAWRLIAGAGGLGLGTYGMGRGGLSGGLIALTGGGLLLRAISNRPLARTVGVSGGRRVIELRKSLMIQAPIDEVFRFWTHVENFPRFMEHILDVKRTGADGIRSHWKVRGPGGVSMSWDAEVTRHESNRLFAWKTLPGSTVEHAGQVHFEEVGPSTTRVHVQMTYNPPAGAVGHAVASLLGADPKRRMDDDLVRLKSLLEEGRTRAHGHQVMREEVESVEATEPTSPHGSSTAPRT